MEENFVELKEATSKKVKGLMWYVGYIIAVGIIGVAAMLLLMEIVFAR